jgi:RIP metalloprotease RseP
MTTHEPPAGPDSPEAAGVTDAAAPGSDGSDVAVAAPAAPPTEAAPDGPVPFAALRLAGLLGALAFLGWLNIWALVVVMAIVVMITMHELGHYLTAKRAGMKVTEFFLFFGPKIWSVRRGETEYGIKLIPAGAYVKIIGMHNLEEVAPADEARTYRQKSFGERVSVAVAGSTMHFLMALGLIFVALAAVAQPGGSLDPERQEAAWEIESVSTGAPAQLAGLRAGDRIVRLDGREVRSFGDLRGLTRPRVGKTVPVTYERDGERRTTDITLRSSYAWSIDYVPEGGAVDEAGLQVGDSVLSVDGVRTTNKSDLDEVLAAVEGRTVAVRYERGGEVETASVPMESFSLVGQKVSIGIHSTTKRERLGVGEALVRTPQEFAKVSRLSIEALGKFFTPGGITDFAGQVGSAGEDREAAKEARPAHSATSGPSATRTDSGSSVQGENRLLSIYGLVRIGSDVGKFDPAALISLFALINIFIGVFNLVPLLPFDGGHVAIAVYEKVQEKRLRRRRYFTDVGRLMPLTYAVVLLLGMLFVSTLYLDIANPLVTS